MQWDINFRLNPLRYGGAFIKGQIVKKSEKISLHLPRSLQGEESFSGRKACVSEVWLCDSSDWEDDVSSSIPDEGIVAESETILPTISQARARCAAHILQLVIGDGLARDSTRIEARTPKIHAVIRRNLKLSVLNYQDTRCEQITVCALWSVYVTNLGLQFNDRRAQLYWYGLWVIYYNINVLFS
jgi:hypothetical protein